MAGFMQKENEVSMLNRIDADVKVESEGKEEDFRELLKKAEKCCPVYNMLNEAGVKLNLNFTNN